MLLLALLAGKYTFLTVMLQDFATFDVTTQLSLMLTVKKVTSFPRTLLGDATKKAHLIYKDLNRSAYKTSTFGARLITTRKKVRGKKRSTFLFELYLTLVFALPVLHFAFLA